MIHSARPTVSPVVNIVSAWNFVVFWKVGTDGRSHGRTDEWTTCVCEKNNDHYRLWLWGGRVDQYLEDAAAGKLLGRLYDTFWNPNWNKMYLGVGKFYCAAGIEHYCQWFAKIRISNNPQSSFKYYFCLKIRLFCILFARSTFVLKQSFTRIHDPPGQSHSLVIIIITCTGIFFVLLYFNQLEGTVEIFEKIVITNGNEWG